MKALRDMLGTAVTLAQAALVTWGTNHARKHVTAIAELCRERAPRDRKRTCRHCSAYIERSDQRCSNDSYCTPIDFGGLGADNARKPGAT